MVVHMTQQYLFILKEVYYLDSQQHLFVMAALLYLKIFLLELYLNGNGILITMGL